MNKEKAIETAKFALAIIGKLLGAVIFWQLVSLFMWACHDAGIPM